MKKTNKILAIILAALLAMTTGITAFADYPVLKENELYGINIVDVAEETVTFMFQPKETSEYVLRSYNNDEDDEIDPYVFLYDEYWEYVASADDNYEDLNFTLRFIAEAGEVYYIEVGSYVGEDSFDIMIEACDEHTECFDNDFDGYCDWCDELLCEHICHKGGIAGFFWKIINFFNSLFFINPVCDCGAWHY